MDSPQNAFIEARRLFTISLWDLFAEVRRSGFPNSRWDYRLFGRGGRENAEEAASDINGQQVHVKATFPKDDNDYVFGLTLTNSPNWDLIVVINTGLGPHRRLTVQAPYHNIDNVSAEVRETLWRSLATIERARTPKPVSCAAPPEHDNWVKQFSRITASFLAGK